MEYEAKDGKLTWNEFYSVWANVEANDYAVTFLIGKQLTSPKAEVVVTTTTIKWKNHNMTELALCALQEKWTHLQLRQKAMLHVVGRLHEESTSITKDKERPDLGVFVAFEEVPIAVPIDRLLDVSKDSLFSYKSPNNMETTYLYHDPQNEHGSWQFVNEFGEEFPQNTLKEVLTDILFDVMWGLRKCENPKVKDFIERLDKASVKDRHEMLSVSIALYE